MARLSVLWATNRTPRPRHVARASIGRPITLRLYPRRWLVQPRLEGQTRELPIVLDSLPDVPRLDARRLALARRLARALQQLRRHAAEDGRHVLGRVAGHARREAAEMLAHARH